MSRKNKKNGGSKIALALLIIIILLVVAIPFVSERFFKNDVKGNKINENNIEQKEKEEVENNNQETEKSDGKKQEKEPDIYTGKYEQTKQETPKTKAQVEENYKKQQSNTVPNWKQNDYDNAKKAEDIVKAEVKNDNYMYVADKLQENVYRVSVRNPDTTENIGFFTVDTNKGKITNED